jgi:hypothetical protein
MIEHREPGGGMNKPRELITGEAAKELGVCNERVRQMHRDGLLPARLAAGRFLMFAAEDVEALRKQRERDRRRP